MQSDNTSQEKKLQALLASLRISEPTQSNYAENFLADFHERRARRIVQVSARAMLWEHLKTYCRNLSGWNWAYGGVATATCAALVAIVWPSGQSSYDVPSIYVGTTVTPHLQPVSVERPVLLTNAPHETLPDFKTSPQSTRFPAPLPPSVSGSTDFLSCPSVSAPVSGEFSSDSPSSWNY